VRRVRLFAIAIPVLLAVFLGASLGLSLRAAGGDRPMVVIADASAGTQPNLDALSSAWPGTVLPNDPADRRFYLLAYRDQVSPRGSTESIQAFQSLLDQLQAGGGEECLDAMFQALALAGRNVPDSRVFLYGDSAPEGDRSRLAFLVNKLVQQGVRVYPSISGWCPEAKLTPESMFSLALLTGGFPFNHQPGQPETAVTRAFNSMALADTLMINQSSVDGVKVFPLDLDNTVTTLGVDEDRRSY
jgi:hypothetical protein